MIVPYQRSLSWAFLGLVINTCIVTPTEGSQKPRRPNILFLFSDDQRADTIAALGNPNIKTPNLDALVHRGTAFLRAYCMGAMQGAVCVPSRAMVLSGRTLFRVKTNLKGVPTWPEMFARAGYRTFLTGKWHNEPESARRIFMEGKAVFFGGMGNPYALPVADISPQRKLVNKRLSGKHSAALFADSVIDFIRGHKSRDGPFFAYVAFNVPHDPRVAPPQYHAYYTGHKPPAPGNFLPLHPFNNGDMVGRDEQLAPWPRTPDIVRQHLADYYSSIAFLDAQIGRILAALRETGLEDDTIIVFSSDSGLSLGSHGLFGKQNLYEDTMRSPLIFAGPGIPNDKQSNALCYLLDICPTLGNLADVAAPEGSEGKSLLPVMQGKTARIRESLFLAYTKVQRSVMDERWQLIVYPQINKTQLFDLQNDPQETRDLSTNPNHAGELQRLTALLRGWQMKSGDTLPLHSARPLPEEFDFNQVPIVQKKTGKTRK